MQKKSGLTWRKLQRDTISNPALRFIANRMKDKRHSVFTLYLTLFCEADDNGFIDLDDLEFLSELSMIEIDDLYEIIDKFLERGILAEIETEDGIRYGIKDWLDPYPTGVKPMTGAERQAKFRQRQKRKKSFADYKKEVDTETLDSVIPEKDFSNFDNDLSEEEWQKILNMSIFEILEERQTNLIENSESNAGVTPVTPPAVTGITKSNEQKRGEEEKEETETERKKLEKEKRELEKKIETELEKIDAVLKEIETEKKEKGEKETRHTQEEAENPQKDIQPPSEEADGRKEGAELNEQSSDSSGPEQTDLQIGAGSKGQAIDTETRERKPPSKKLPKPEKIKKCYEILWEFFKKNNKMGFFDEKNENLACTQLAVRIAKLESPTNSAEIIAIQFVNCFRRLIKGGGYFENMPCTPQLLLKTGNYTKVFHAVSKILHPMDEGGRHWAEELEQTLKNDAVNQARSKINNGIF